MVLSDASSIVVICFQISIFAESYTPAVTQYNSGIVL